MRKNSFVQIMPSIGLLSIIIGFLMKKFTDIPSTYADLFLGIGGVVLIASFFILRRIKIKDMEELEKLDKKIKKK